MHYYQHHIGDFMRDTSRLKDSQCMAYLRLIWMYYDTEMPLVNNPKKLAFQIGAEVDDVELILEHFFYLDRDVWRHKRCDEEIEAFYKKSAAASEKAKKRWGKDKDNVEKIPQQCRSNATASKNDATHIPIYPYTQEEPIHTPTTVPNSNQEETTPTPAARVCRELRDSGIENLNPANPLLLELLKAGASVNEFVQAAKVAKEKGKGFNYLLAIVKGQRKEAKEAAKQVLHGDLPNKSPPGNSKKFQKFSGFDYINGGDGYGNKREPDEGRIIDGEVAVDVPKIQGKEAN